MMHVHFSVPERQPAYPSNVARLKTLREDGICIIENFFSSNSIIKMKEEVWESAELLRRDKLGPEHRSRRMPDDSLYRLYEISSIAPSTHEFFENAELTDLVTGYIGRSPRLRRGYLDYKVGKAKFDTAAIPHFDNFLPEVKIFLLLTDVKPTNAPMVYWAGSHARARWRWLYDYLYYTGTSYGINGFVGTSVLDDLEAQGTVRPITCTFGAGTLIIADTRGVHRGTIIEDDFRLQLVDVIKT